MTFNKIMSIVIILFFFITSCEKEILEKTAPETETLTLDGKSTENPDKTADEVVERMRLETIEFLKLTGEPITEELLSGTARTSRAVHNAFNYGTISVGYPSAPYSNYLSLNSGTRTGTTQWASLNLYNTQLSVAPDQYTYNRSGTLSFSLNGLGQSANLDFSINPATLNATITPNVSYYTTLHSRQIPNTSFALSNHLELTVHSNTSGWLWIQVKSSGTTVFSSLYRYTYSSRLDTRNGGTVRAYRFGPAGVGPLPPHTPAGINTSYSGYSGWF